MGIVYGWSGSGRWRPPGRIYGAVASCPFYGAAHGLGIASSASWPAGRAAAAAVKASPLAT